MLKWKEIYCIKCKKYRKFKNLFYKTLAILLFAENVEVSMKKYL